MALADKRGEPYARWGCGSGCSSGVWAWAWAHPHATGEPD
jgi:hypothetical protein